MVRAISAHLESAVANNNLIGRVLLRDLAVGCAFTLKETILKILFGVAAHHPSRSGGVDDGVEGLGGSAASEVEELLGIVRSLQNLNVRLE